MKQLAPGDHLGRYEILRRLGAGAMGEVYLAEDPQIGRRVAVKTVRVEEGKPQEMEERKRRLLREARAAGRLLHPNIVALFDAGEDQGLLYLAFEWVDGCDLAQRIEGEPLTLREAIAIVRQAAEGLDYAHRQGIVHRDIKPSNLLLGGGGQVKISDFGIAKLADQTSDLTMTGSVVGSPHYLSPEQIRGDELDGRSDLFSLGVLFYEVLSRHRPFEGESLTTLVYQILHRDPPSIAVNRPELGTRLEGILQRMLHKDRDERFPSAGELARALAECAQELPASILDAPAARDGAPPDATRRMSTSERAAPVVPPPAVPPPPPSPTQTPTVLVAPRAAAPASRSGLWIAAAVGLALVVALIAGGFAARRWVAARQAAKAQTQQTASAEPTPGSSSGRTSNSPVAPRGVSAEPAAGATPPVDGPATSASGAGDARPAEPSLAPGERFVQRPVPPPPAEPRPRQPSTETRTEPIAAAPRPVPTPVDSAPAEPEAPADEGAGDAAPPAAERPDAALRIDRNMVTGMALSFAVLPPESIVKVDGRVIGQAWTWQVKKREGRAYDLPEPGEHLVRIIHPTTGRNYVIRVTASSDAPSPTVVSVDLRPGADQGKKPRRLGGRDRDGG